MENLDCVDVLVNEIEQLDVFCTDITPDFNVSDHEFDSLMHAEVRVALEGILARCFNMDASAISQILGKDYFLPDLTIEQIGTKINDYCFEALTRSVGRQSIDARLYGLAPDATLPQYADR